MECEKNLEYRICFNLVENLDFVKKDKNFLGSLELEGNIYSITLNESSKMKEFAKNLAYSFLPEFKKLFYIHLKSSGEPIGRLKFDKYFSPLGEELSRN